MVKKMSWMLVGLLLLFFAGCADDADVASYNLSKAADQFELNRRVVFYNGITGEYLLTIEGRLSIKADGIDNQLEVTCKTGASEFKKHTLGLSDNVTYFCEQLDSAKASVYRYKVIFKPSTIIPDVEYRKKLGDADAN